ncbi:MAG: chemotaxis protein CheW [Thermoanaerobaculaceae bacterium]|nr:chemotaxis protein CheW [Thermoanaerobaculaceae bacterium]
MNREREGGAHGGRYLVVATGEHLCAMAVEQVRSVVPALTVVPCPATDPNLLGLAEYGGEPLPVLDLAALVGAPAGAVAEFPVTVVVRTRGEGGSVGLAADAAVGVVEVPPHLTATGSGLVQARGTWQGTVLHVLELAALGGERRQ